MPGVARKDGVDQIATGHTCDETTATDSGSPNVFANGIGVVRVNDTSAVHNWPVEETSTVPAEAVDDPSTPRDETAAYDEIVIVCKPHIVYVNTFSPNVYANFRNIARQGDVYGVNQAWIDRPGPGDETLTSGSGDVFANS